ncbi:hypothetical protein C8R46DRAFT_1235569 [Mycena filopes]|nr:hypothetical protein C8R46DRAFT_1235569 [Mycena filopes]
MSFALPARQVTFGRSNARQQQNPAANPVPPQNALAPRSISLGKPIPANPIPSSDYKRRSRPIHAPRSFSRALDTHPPHPRAAAHHCVEGIVPTLQNIVATVNLDCRLDLKTIALHARNAEYNPKRFAAVIMRIRDPKTTALIFASGKMVVTGAKSEDDSRLASRKYARIVQKLGFEAKFSEFKIQNIVGS